MKGSDILLFKALLLGMTSVMVTALHPKEIQMQQEKSKEMFFGKLYMGSTFVETDVIYDTMSPVTTVNLKKCDGALLNSSYDFATTETESPVRYTTYENDQPIQKKKSGVFHYNGGSTTMQGDYYTDQMCLEQVENPDERSFESGKLCVKSQEFLAVDMIYPEKSFSENGVLGLAPTETMKSIVKTMHDNKIIQDELISLNYEDGNHSITFGEIDYAKIPGGKDGLNYFSNVGQNSWAVVIDHMTYNNVSISREIDYLEDFIHLKMAYIDSGNSSIQLLYSDFQNLYNAMYKQDNSIQTHCQSDQRCSLRSDRKCEDLKGNLSPLEFFIQDSKITIQPHGFLDQLDEVVKINVTGEKKEGDEVKINTQVKSYCLIGIESIPDDENHYRLGIQFLRNFYTALDYEHDVIVFALNNHGHNSGANATVDPTGKQPPKEIMSPNYEPLVAIIFFFISAILIALGVFKYKLMKEEAKESGRAANSISQLEEEESRIMNDAGSGAGMIGQDKVGEMMGQIQYAQRQSMGAGYEDLDSSPLDYNSSGLNSQGKTPFIDSNYNGEDQQQQSPMQYL